MKTSLINKLEELLPDKCYFNTLDSDNKNILISHILTENETRSLKRRYIDGMKYSEIAEQDGISRQGVCRICTRAVEKVSQSSDIDLAFPIRLSFKLRRAGITSAKGLDCLKDSDIDSLQLTASESRAVYEYLGRSTEDLELTEEGRLRSFIRKVMKECDKRGGLKSYHILTNSYGIYSYICTSLLERNSVFRNFYKKYDSRSKIPAEIAELVIAYDEDLAYYGSDVAALINAVGVIDTIPAGTSTLLNTDLSIIRPDPTRPEVSGKLAISYFDIAFMPGELGRKEELLNPVPKCDYTEVQELLLNKLRNEFNCEDLSSDMLCAIISSLDETRKKELAAFIMLESDKLSKKIRDAFKSPVLLKNISPLMAARLISAGINDIRDVSLLSVRDLETFCPGYLDFYCTLFASSDIVNPEDVMDRFPAVFRNIQKFRNIPMYFDKQTKTLTVGESMQFELSGSGNLYDFWRDVFLYDTISITGLVS